MKTVSFTQMKDGTKADYDLLAEAEKPYHALTADRILTELRKQDEDDQPEHRDIKQPVELPHGAFALLNQNR